MFKSLITNCIAVILVPVTGSALFRTNWFINVVLGWVVIFRLPRLLTATRPSDTRVMDFFQDWSSARGYLDGLFVYSKLSFFVESYLGFHASEDRLLVTVNAHPPASILLFLPFAYLPYETAFFFWNLLSLAMVGAACVIILNGLGIPLSIQTCLPLTAFLLLCHPLYQQLAYGQLSALLMLLTVIIWWSDRTELPILAGTLLGVAASVKLFPLLLVLYFMVRRKWLIVLLGLFWFIVINAVAAALFGIKTYSYYVLIVIPEVQWHRNAWDNASLTGFFGKLFQSPVVRLSQWSTTLPIINAPYLARTLSFVFSFTIVLLASYMASKSFSPRSSDSSYSLFLVATILVSPISWCHYFLLLVLPVAVALVFYPKTRCLSYVSALLLYSDTSLLWGPLLGQYPGTFVASTPLTTILVLSLPCYGLLLLFWLLIKAPYACENIQNTNM